MDELSKAVDDFHYVYNPMRIPFNLVYRAHFAYGENIVEVFQKQELSTEKRRIIKAEGETQAEAYEDATRDLIRWYQMKNYQKERKNN